jgi:hypothetical protein
MLTRDGVMQAPGGPAYEIFTPNWSNAPESAIGMPPNDATKYVAWRSRPSPDRGPGVPDRG